MPMTTTFFTSNKVTFPGFSVAHIKRSRPMTSQKTSFFPELPGHKNFVAFCGALWLFVACGFLGLFVVFYLGYHSLATTANNT
jgi:hypothetical protein